MTDSSSNYQNFEHPQNTPACKWDSEESLIESKSSGNPIKRQLDTRKVTFKNAKMVLQRPSAFTTETLYDHLVEIIMRIIDERPLNVIDYFEQFSRDVRKHKSRLSAFVSPPSEPEFLGPARAVLKSLWLNSADESELFDEEVLEGSITPATTDFLSSASSLRRMHRTLAKSENVIQLQHYWALCGLGFQMDEVFQLSWAIQKIQNHHSIRSARFWGRIYGAGASYYIVEADVTRTERLLRLAHMEAKLVNDMIAFIQKSVAEPQEVDAELTPGYSWPEYHVDEFKKMQPPVAPVPRLIIKEPFEMPPEPIGTGLNRMTYFVTRALSEDWKELPMVTSKQVVASRKIRKYFTGDLEAGMSTYPAFPGTEKSYLRAMIARVTAASYIAPNGFFRKMTRKERLAAEREGESPAYDEGEEEESDFEDELAEDIIDNDCPIIEDEKYKPISSHNLKLPCAWVHCRPHILRQGTVTYIDEDEVIKNLAKLALRRMKRMEIGAGEDGGEGGELFDIESDAESNVEQDAEEEFSEEEYQRDEPEAGPELFSFAGCDRNSEDMDPWSSRSSEYCHSGNPAIIMRSNLWPGAYSFVHGKWCDSIYLGWGAKFVARCGSMEPLPEIQNLAFPDDVLEATDPTVEMEKMWRHYQLEKDFNDAVEEMGISIETDIDDDEVEAEEGFAGGLVRI